MFEPTATDALRTTGVVSLQIYIDFTLIQNILRVSFLDFMDWS